MTTLTPKPNTLTELNMKLMAVYSENQPQQSIYQAGKLLIKGRMTLDEIKTCLAHAITEREAELIILIEAMGRCDTSNLASSFELFCELVTPDTLPDEITLDGTRLHRLLLDGYQ